MTNPSPEPSPQAGAHPGQAVRQPPGSMWSSPAGEGREHVDGVAVGQGRE